MSQEQPRRSQEEPIKYGDVFNVSGKLANKPITPQDAADMQAAETKVLGQTVKGGPAAVMQSTANVNENRGLVGRYDDQGIAVSDTEYAGHQIITESVGGEATVMSAGSKLVDQADAAAIQAAEVRATGRMQAVPGGDATKLLPEDKPVTRVDAEAVIEAEIRNKPNLATTPGGVASAVDAAAKINQQK
ncbi:Seed maturation protein [Cynara cardunculus var. scolymus]|uniref:Seed maturation protein n=1 Tax=Cynara cardunculus var. scolymus TaxID=59895 RepID=A0A103XP68_CYNCS|nr:Seed maturation protein [Cynara cardunculus var. scolymus]